MIQSDNFQLIKQKYQQHVLTLDVDQTETETVQDGPVLRPIKDISAFLW